MLQSGAARAERIKMSPQLVAGLDLARAVAAIYVVAHHVANTLALKGVAGVALRFGQEAVIGFFLLSGFLIFAHEHARRDGVWAYAGRRIRRVYPGLLIAMAISTAIFAYLGLLGARFSWFDLLGNLAGLQDVSRLKPGVIVDTYLGNSPLWSLSYELFFYLIFPAVLAGWTRYPRGTTHIVGAAGCLAYCLYLFAPNHLAKVIAYFPIWWAGAMAARAYLSGERSLRAIVAALVWLTLLSGIALLDVIIQGYTSPGVFPFLPLRHFAVALVMIIIFFGPFGRIWSRLALSMAAPAAWLASISYGLYLFHYPILINSGAIESWPGFALGLGLLILIAWLGDARLNRVLQRWSGGKRSRKAEIETVPPPPIE
ncbi:acyltransferase family protein [Sphingomonas sp.]|uniref:acyltransferase family protein n=1 Tax=Sphingomonas sp. TaxID=28214 RepID=UPI003D6C70BF